VLFLTFWHEMKTGQSPFWVTFGSLALKIAVFESFISAGFEADIIVFYLVSYLLNRLSIEYGGREKFLFGVKF